LWWYILLKTRRIFHYFFQRTRPAGWVKKNHVSKKLTAIMVHLFIRISDACNVFRIDRRSREISYVGKILRAHPNESARTTVDFCNIRNETSHPPFPLSGEKGRKCFAVFNKEVKKWQMLEKYPLTFLYFF